MTPVFKKDEDTNTANYRPISILTAFSNAFQTSSVVEYVRRFKAPFLLTQLSWKCPTGGDL